MENKQEPKTVQREHAKSALLLCVCLAVGIGMAVYSGSVPFALLTAGACVAVVWLFAAHSKKLSGPVIEMIGVCIDTDQGNSPASIGKRMLFDLTSAITLASCTYVFDCDGKILTLRTTTPQRFFRKKKYRLYLSQDAVKETDGGLTADSLCGFDAIK